MPADRLERMRASAERLLEDAAATLEEPTTAPDGAGGRTVDYSAVSGAVSAALALPSRTELEEAAARYGSTPAMVLRVAHDSPITELWRVTIAGETWRVVGELTRSESWKVLKRLAVVPA